MRFVISCSGRKVGVGYGFKRQSDGCRLPFPPFFDLSKDTYLHHTPTRRGDMPEDAPVVELIFDPENADRWVIQQSRYADFRVNPDGSRTAVSGYGYAQLLYPEVEAGERPDRSVALSAAAAVARRFGWMDVARWQQISEDEKSAFGPLQMPEAAINAPECAVGGSCASEAWAQLILSIWKAGWARHEGRPFTPVDVLIAPAERPGDTLSAGLEFLAGALNRALPDAVKPLLSVAVGVPHDMAKTFQGSVVRILYREEGAAWEKGCFDACGGRLTAPAANFDPLERALIAMLSQGKRPALFDALCAGTDDAWVNADYDNLMLCSRIEQGFLEGCRADLAQTRATVQQPVDTVWAALVALRGRLRSAGLDDAAVNRVLRGEEARFFGAMSGSAWPGGAQQRVETVRRLVYSDGAKATDGLWNACLRALLDAAATDACFAALNDGLFAIEDYGAREQDHLRFYEIFEAMAQRAMERGELPSEAALKRLQPLLGRYVKDPSGDAAAYDRFRDAIAALLTARAVKDGEIANTVLEYLNAFRFNPAQLAGLEDLSVAWLRDYPWTGCEAQIQQMQAVRRMDEAQATRKLCEALNGEVARQSAGPVTAQRLDAFARFVSAVQAPAQTGNLCAMLAACPEPLGSDTLAALRAQAEDGQALRGAALEHLTRAPEASAAELIAWAQQERDAGGGDAALAELAAQRLAGGCRPTEAELATLVDWLRGKLGEEAADRAALACCDATGVGAALAEKAAMAQVKRNDWGGLVENKPSGALALKSLFALFEASWNDCGRFEDLAGMPGRAPWASRERFDAAWNWAKAQGDGVQRQCDLHQMALRLARAEAAEQPAGLWQPLEGAQALRKKLLAGKPYPALSEALLQELSACAAEPMMGECLRAVLAEGDRDACRQAAGLLRRYAGALEVPTGGEAVKPLLSAADWVEALLTARSCTDLSGLTPAKGSAAALLSGAAPRLMALAEEVIRAEGVGDRHAGRCLAALQLARLSAPDGDVDWQRFRGLMGAEGGAAEARLAAWAQRVMAEYLPDAALDESLMQEVMRREEAGVKLPLPEKYAGESSLAAWIKRQKGR